MDAIRQRKSIRAYTAEPVAQDAVRELLEAAIAAPTNSNAQPWKFYVVAGERKQELDATLLGCLEESRSTSNELQTERDGGDPQAQETLSARRTTLTRGIMQTLTENDLPLEVFARGSFKFFGAPVAIVVTMDQSVPESIILSVGSAVENLLLAAVAKGLGTCWIGMTLMYSKEIKQALGIPDTERVITTLALGYPDKESPLNAFKSTRDDFDAFVTWIGWE
jgi:nitroreductase